VPARPQPSLVVTFHKVNGPPPSAWWEAVRRTGGRVRGGHMPIGRGRIPHDLGHMATEAHLGIADGFWGLLALGATFKRGTDCRPTQRGRAIVRNHRAQLDTAEAIGNAHHSAWVSDDPTPVGPTFDRLSTLWAATPDGGSLTIRWPTLEVLEPSSLRPSHDDDGCDQPSTGIRRRSRATRVTPANPPSRTSSR